MVGDVGEGLTRDDQEMVDTPGEVLFLLMYCIKDEVYSNIF